MGGIGVSKESSQAEWRLSRRAAASARNLFIGTIYSQYAFISVIYLDVLIRALVHIHCSTLFRSGQYSVRNVSYTLSAPIPCSQLFRSGRSVRNVSYLVCSNPLFDAVSICSSVRNVWWLITDAVEMDGFECFFFFLAHWRDVPEEGGEEDSSMGGASVEPVEGPQEQEPHSPGGSSWQTAATQSPPTPRRRHRLLPPYGSGEWQPDIVDDVVQRPTPPFQQGSSSRLPPSSSVNIIGVVNPNAPEERTPRGSSSSAQVMYTTKAAPPELLSYIQVCRIPGVSSSSAQPKAPPLQVKAPPLQLLSYNSSPPAQPKAPPRGWASTRPASAPPLDNRPAENAQEGPQPPLPPGPPPGFLMALALFNCLAMMSGRGRRMDDEQLKYKYRMRVNE